MRPSPPGNWSGNESASANWSGNEGATVAAPCRAMLRSLSESAASGVWRQQVFYTRRRNHPSLKQVVSNASVAIPAIISSISGEETDPRHTSRARLTRRIFNLTNWEKPE
ncbi:hypothetical protein ElyMa_000118200 [Elysia marginata]|uniref:Uncharacterized protein n=1 Tax=Elysia marginata TaxID=1093978 RepID=A0AAV4ENG2_9GAST|nr:hypothetical protein ElyMa_000118200 [Elysia marginata]